ncbi:MerR family transcriptional regulator [Actinoplanes sp. CA-030573]|uniref:MerR family transcriptional regulator n=1 Tax=Actinoplanes sp. CA-030573 TaxID=3239898 RepID=UPI003D910A55
MTLSVGELAKRSGVPATTLRYYDAIGLLVPQRLANGHRRYPQAAVGRLELVRACRSLGLSLEEVAAVLGPAAGSGRREVAERKLSELDRTLGHLTAVRAVLAHFAQCRHTAPDDCEADVRTALSASNRQV